MALWALSCLLPGCASDSGALTQVINTGLRAGSAAVSDATAPDGCAPRCPTGTQCDSIHRYCVALPCHGRCSDQEQCRSDRGIDTCVPKSIRNGNTSVQPSKDAKTEP